MINGIAVTGTGVVTALGPGVDHNWSAITAGAAGLRRLVRFDADAFQTGVGGEVTAEVEDLLRKRLDMSHQGRALVYATAAATEALEQASRRDCRDMLLVVSTTKGEMELFERSLADGDLPAAGAALPWDLAKSLARVLGAEGGVLAVSNACASGLVALMQAAAMLERSEADSALVVGVDTISRFVLAGFTSLAALSREGCRPYDADREGLSLGEGAGAMVLERNPETAQARLLSAAVTNDANHITAPLKTGEGLRRAIVQALDGSGVAATEIDVVNGHGTGTIYNDAMEARALSGVFGRKTPPVYSLKGQLGHTLGAAGVVEAVVALKGLGERTAPGTLGLTEVDEDFSLQVSPKAVPTGAVYALCVKSGFGGVNAAAVFERVES